METSDIFPTLCDLVGIEYPKTVQGKSFSELFTNPNSEFRKNAYSRYTQADCLITERFSYTLYGNAKSEMLYDLTNDPEENINLSAVKEYQEIKEELKKQLNDRMKEAR